MINSDIRTIQAEFGHARCKTVSFDYNVPYAARSDGPPLDLQELADPHPCFLSGAVTEHLDHILDPDAPDN